MFKFYIDTKEYSLPTSYKELTTRQYLNLIDNLKLYVDDDGNQIDIEEEKMVLILLNSFLGLKEQEQNKISVRDMLLIKHYLQFLRNKTEINKKQKIIVDGIIIKPKNLNKLSIGEYLNIMQLLTTDNDISEIYSLIYDYYIPRNILKFRFRNKKIELTKEQRINLMDKMSYEDFNTTVFFFMSSITRYVKDIQYYLNKQALRMHISVILQALGAIIYGSWTYVKKTLLFWKK